jgi:PTS system nitrogen regulatory IIA component
LELIDFIPAEAIVFRLGASDATGVIRELASALARAHGLDRGLVETLLLDREHLGSTALGPEVAAPHARMDVSRAMGAIGLSERGIEFGAPDGDPVRIVVAFVAPREGGGDLRALDVVSRAFADPVLRKKLFEVKSADEIHALLSSNAGANGSPRQ